MRFEEIATEHALGWSLAHSVSAGNRKIAKGTTLDAAAIAQLVAAGISHVHAFSLDTGDLDENTIAEAAAKHLAGGGLRCGRPTRGRANLYAEADGLLIAGDSVGRFNASDEALTIATLPNLAPVRAGQLVATVKIIPYAVSEERLKAALIAPQALALAPFQPFTARFLVSGNELPDKTRKLTENRLSAVGGTVQDYKQCAHTVVSVCDALLNLQKEEGDLILMLGVSAISDRRDILPAALEAAGGDVIQLGMPVDPGNLLMLGRLGDKTVLGLPGCARSPALNGLDWVLERFAAQLPLTTGTLRGMGVGGLLKETALRPEPRAPRRTSSDAVQALILAAGRSSRTGGKSKLLRALNGKAVVAQTVSVAAEGTSSAAVVVTGHDAKAVADALSGYPCRIVTNENYETGMASSLKLGLDGLDSSTEFCLICLGDMPFVRTETIDALRESAVRMGEAKIFIPTFNGKRGHPVLWHQSLFAELKSITGDKGGRDIIHARATQVCEVPVADPGILIDLDTPELLAQFGMDAPG